MILFFLFFFFSETSTYETLQEVKVREVNSTRSDTPEEVRYADELAHDRLLSDNIDVEGNFISGTYPLNQDKIWQLKIPKGCQMRVTFETFDIETTPKCVRDYFSVQTSKNPEEVLVFCDELVEILIKRRKRVQFKFHSDNGEHAGGIHAKVCLQELNASEEDRRCNCGPSSKRQRRTIDSICKLSILVYSCCSFVLIRAKMSC